MAITIAKGDKCEFGQPGRVAVWNFEVMPLSGHSVTHIDVEAGTTFTVVEPQWQPPGDSTPTVRIELDFERVEGHRNELFTVETHAFRYGTVRHFRTGQ